MKFLTTLAVVATALTIGVTGVAAQPDGYQPQLRQPTQPDGYQPQLGEGAPSQPFDRYADQPVDRVRRRRRRGFASGLAGRAPGRRRGGRADRGRRLRLQLGERRRRRARRVARRGARRRRRLCDAREASPRAPLSQGAKRRLFRTCLRDRPWDTSVSGRERGRRGDGEALGAVHAGPEGRGAGGGVGGASVVAFEHGPTLTHRSALDDSVRRCLGGAVYRTT